MISRSWFLFHEEVVEIKHYLEKFLSHDKQVIFSLENNMNYKIVTVNCTNNVVKYYIGCILTDIKHTLNKLYKLIVRI